MIGELLSVVTKYIEIEDVYNLYLMGNRLMIDRMRYNDMYLISDFRYKSIKFLNIKIVHININEDDANYTFASLKTQFSNLRFLKMNGDNLGDEDVKDLPRSLFV
jgi:hypothetical protein